MRNHRNHTRRLQTPRHTLAALWHEYGGATMTGEGKGRALPDPGSAQTGVVIGRSGLPFAALTPVAEQALVELLAAALVADLLDETRHDGRFPFGTRPTTEGQR